MSSALQAGETGSIPVQGTFVYGPFVYWLRIAVFQAAEDGSKPSRATILFMAA